MATETSSAMKYRDSDTQNIVNVMFNQVLDHMKKTDGLYMRGWEIQIIRAIHTERVLEDNFFITSAMSLKVEEIHGRLVMEGRI